jgi:hypothetical protein
MEFSRCTRAARPTEINRREGGLSKLNSVNIEVDVIPGELEHRTETASIHGSNAYRSNCSDIP